MYQRIDIILATKHKKEDAICKPFEDAFKAKLHVPDDYDTDRFGTFTGEISRQDTAYETVIKKAKEASLKYKFDYAIANEGSFGPHPTINFAPGDIELISFIDQKNDLVVVESEITTETNYAQLQITVLDDYTHFLEKIKFGSHGLIVRSMEDEAIIAKGINQVNELKTIVHSAFQYYETLRLETDMRAMMNPTRMSVINKLAIKLVKRLKCYCTQCKMPGFGKVSVKGNLLCALCCTETELYQFKVLSCIKCDYQEFIPRQDGIEKADPTYCSYCNP
jgi:hypothetical protein